MSQNYGSIGGMLAKFSESDGSPLAAEKSTSMGPMADTLAAALASASIKALFSAENAASVWMT